MKVQVLNRKSKAKTTCKYVVASSYELLKTSMFLKINDNSTINENTFRGGHHDKFYIKVIGIYRTIDL